MKEKPEVDHSFGFGFFSKPLAFSSVRHLHIGFEENEKAMSFLVPKQANYLAFVGLFLALLSVAYMVMFYGFGMSPDDQFFSVIAMFLLFGSSLSYLGAMAYFFFSKKENPTVARVLALIYQLCLWAVTALYFYAACTNSASRDSFCPSFLYLLIFTLLSSPYFSIRFLSLSALWPP
jgi:hypothetical protein